MHVTLKYWCAALTLTFLISCHSQSASKKQAIKKELTEKQLKNKSVAYFASGCFWCVEAVFESVEGVHEAVSGYCGGEEKNPSYELVCSGESRHTETVMVYYDSTIISYEKLLLVFFDSHNPETLNQQGPDRGPQYRSAIFYKTEKEKEIISQYIQKLLSDGKFKKITTEVSPLDIFYPAEAYHQDYERNNPNNPYVKAVSIPRLRSFQTMHPELLKK